MAWFADLSPYSYSFVSTIGWGEDGPPIGGTDALFRWMNDEYEPAFAHDEVNVGWLDTRHPFPTADATEEFVGALRHACATQRYAVMRGLHGCPYCAKAHGHSEIRIQGEGVVYAAPWLVGHYVERHRYATPSRST